MNTLFVDKQTLLCCLGLKGSGTDDPGQRRVSQTTTSSEAKFDVGLSTTPNQHITYTTAQLHENLSNLPTANLVLNKYRKHAFKNLFFFSNIKVFVFLEKKYSVNQRSLTEEIKNDDLRVRL